MYNALEFSYRFFSNISLYFILIILIIANYFIVICKKLNNFYFFILNSNIFFYSCLFECDFEQTHNKLGQNSILEKKIR